MSDDEALAALAEFGAALIALHAIAEAADAARQLSDDLWRAELLRSSLDELPELKDLAYRPPLD